MISCPSCSQPINPKDRYCPHCGVDMGLAAVLAEEELRRGTDELRFPLTPEVLIPRIGDYLKENNLVTQSQINQAVEFQNEREREGKPVLIGQALVEMGVLDQRKLDKVITEQIFQLQSALRRANLELEDRVVQRTSELQRAMVRLAELSQLKSNFIANISHELRTPLTHMKGYLEILKDESLGPLNNEQKEALGVMIKSEIRLEQLIEDLIQFSIAARGEFEIKLSELNVDKLLRTAIRKAESESRKKGVQLTANIPEKVPPAFGDTEKIGWVVSELINNSLKFTQDAGIIEIGAVIEYPEILIYVKDNGIGIPEDQIDRIFEPFHQIDGSTTRRYGGTGLGLSLAQRIIEAHGSQIVVKSKMDKGTKITFGLTIAESS